MTVSNKNVFYNNSAYAGGAVYEYFVSNSTNSSRLFKLPGAVMNNTIEHNNYFNENVAFFGGAVGAESSNFTV